MADRVLRDQCEHGRYDDHSTRIAYKWERCPGGREVTIDYEAAANELWKSFKEQADTLEAAKSIVDAALEV